MQDSGIKIAYSSGLKILKSLVDDKRLDVTEVISRLNKVLSYIEVQTTLLEGKIPKSLKKARVAITTLLNNIESKKLKKSSELNSQIKEVYVSYDTAKTSDMPIGNSIDADFSIFDKSYVKLPDPQGKPFFLLKAPFAFVLGAPILDTEKKHLQLLDAEFFSGTGLVLIPTVSILVINLTKIDKRVLESATKQIISDIVKKDPPVPLHDFAIIKNNLYAVPCFRPQLLPKVHSILSNKSIEAKLLIK